MSFAEVENGTQCCLRALSNVGTVPFLTGVIKFYCGPSKLLHCLPGTFFWVAQVTWFGFFWLIVEDTCGHGTNIFVEEFGKIEREDE